MKKVWKLAISFVREHPARLILTSLATVAAAGMVIWIAAGYDSLLRTFDVWANKALGRYELSIAPIATEGKPTVPPAVLEAMRADPQVADTCPMWMTRATVRSAVSNESSSDSLRPSQGTERPGGGGRGDSNLPYGLRSQFTVLASEAPQAPFDIQGRWFGDPPATGQAATGEAAADASEGVLSVGAAERLGVKVGDEVAVVVGDRPFPLQVIGLLESPSLGAGMYAVPNILSPGSGDLFVSTRLAERMFETSSRIDFLCIAMKSKEDITKFRFGWAPKLSRYDVPVQFQEAYEIEEALDESAAADNVQMQSYAATGIGMLVAMLVIFGTVSMGVTERVRQFAVLRAVVLTRMQLAFLIFAEGLLLAAIGFVGGVGVSWILLSLTARASSRLLHHGAVLGTHSLLLAAVATFGGALLAAAIPAWRATRVRPVDAMAPPAAERSSFLSVPVAAAGLVLLAINPLLTFVFPPSFEQQVYAYLAIGFASTAAGFVLIAPTVVALVDRLLGPWLARLLRIDPKLVASQITAHIWRTAAAAISMAIGMGLFIAVQVWGFTMLDAFIVGPWAPDAILTFQSGGLPPERAGDMARIPGIDPEHCLPIVVEQPRLLNDLTGSAERASVTRQDNVVLVGIDPVRAFGGARPLFELEWVGGTREEAIARMASAMAAGDRACLVPDHFLTESGLKVGDHFDLVPPENAAAPVRYTIAGAVRLPGWHWQTKLTGFRSRTHRAAALVFADYAAVAADFGLPGATHLWFDYDSPQADPKRISEAAQTIYAAAIPPPAASDAGQESPKVRLMAVEDIRRMTRSNAARWIWAISQLPLIAVLIAGLGVLNVILASVRSRRWEMGVLRSIGVTQSAIVRAILAEGILIGVVAGLLSLGFGIMAGWCGCGMAQYISFFGGLHPDLNVPVVAVVTGLLAVVVLAALAALWPAMSIGRLRPLTLLQQGRMTF